MYLTGNPFVLGAQTVKGRQCFCAVVVRNFPDLKHVTEGATTILSWTRASCSMGQVFVQSNSQLGLVSALCTSVCCTALLFPFPIPTVSSQLPLQAAQDFHILSILQASCYLFEVSMSGRRKWPRAFPWRCCRGPANGLHRQMGFRAFLCWEYIETFKEQLEVQGA